MYWYYVSSLAACLQPDGSFPHGLLSLLGPGTLLPSHCCHGLALKAARGWNPISTPPFAFQQSFQSLALDSLLLSGFRPLMNSDDGDKRWWHSPLMSGTCQWSLEFVMKWIRFRFTFFFFFKLPIKNGTDTGAQKLGNRHRISLEDETLSDLTVEKKLAHDPYKPYERNNRYCTDAHAVYWNDV